MSYLLTYFNRSKRVLTVAIQNKDVLVDNNVKLFHFHVCCVTYRQTGPLCQPSIPEPLSKHNLYLPWSQPMPQLQIFFRQKHTKKKSSVQREEQDDNLDEEGDEAWENDASNKDSRIVKVKVNSLRTDLVLKAGLNIARNKIETFFYESKIRVNGQKIFKKSSQVHIGDEVDIIRGVSPMNPEFLLVSRVEILAARDNPDGTLTAQIRRTKAITVENYDDDNKFV